MCGIAGSVNCKLTNQSIDLISHRGPDSQALIDIEVGNDRIYFGHTRLSILDLSEAGSQPMFTDCGNYCITFNGEIYNHKQLRQRISDVSFKGQSDTETILYYLREFGIEGVKDFNGIFAFSFFDRRNGKIYLVRDWFGTKPLYYYLNGNKLLFSSEIKVILNNPEYKKEIDENSLNSFLTFRYNPAPQTLYKGIKKLEAASYLEFTLGGNVKQTDYWPKVQKIDNTMTEQDALVEYRRLLDQSVERQLLSDVPVGLLLSGGLDSAVLGKLMSEKSAYQIKTFTVGFEGKGNYNELDDARITSQLINSEHHEIYMEKDTYMNYFYKSFYHTEEPIAEPTIPALFYLSNLASKHVKVVLSGQGADEPMAGYKRYKGEKFISDYRKLLSMLPLSLASTLFPNNSTIDRGIYSAKFKEELDRFIAIYTLFTPDLKSKLYQTGLQDQIGVDQKFLFKKAFDRTDKDADSLSKLLFLDTRTMLPDNLLLFNDKLTMANSIENRVPYLDIDLVNFLETVPIGLKLKGQTGKYIHKKASEEWLPKSIIHRKKRGFETPVGDWFKTELSDSLLSLVDSSDSLSRKYFNTPYIKDMIHQHRTMKRDYKKQLFILLSLELWHSSFFKSDFSTQKADLQTAIG
ncbi:asparagine synthase (glutamine-hydrolyzing) [Dyadobacter sp. CY326]|uniref:asparagine synthase (glutamine-hydrolyzing) n=1 Tax=Dyadobacter sp. CY326 TaxID=2907300 RepID=UPI001F3CFF06|nr:asparagine synthase (glutamine-hydrolyzing) [Dyadobacter sp. CY326]MCE7066595.1 asparagine synthase (glutamine-hydrolyzing) [Dyadobacter sp. CY326]